MAACPRGGPRGHVVWPPRPASDAPLRTTYWFRPENARREVEVARNPPERRHITKLRLRDQKLRSGTPPGLDLAMGSPSRAARPDPARKTRAWAEICWPDTRAGPGLGSPKTEIKPTARPAARWPGGLGVFLAGPGRAWADFFCVGPISGRPEARPDTCPGITSTNICTEYMNAYKPIG
jgi:hypothetical protein